METEIHRINEEFDIVLFGVEGSCVMIDWNAEGYEKRIGVLLSLDADSNILRLEGMQKFSSRRQSQRDRSSIKLLVD